MFFFFPAPFSRRGLSWMTVLLGSLQAVPFLYRRLRMCMEGRAKSKPQLLRGGLGGMFTEAVHSVANCTRGTTQLWTCVRHVYRSSSFRSSLNTSYTSYITALDMCEVCTEAVHSVALWTRQLWTCVAYVYRSCPFRSALKTSYITALDRRAICTEAVQPFRSSLNSNHITALDVCEVCTEEVHSVALWIRVTPQLRKCVWGICTEAVHSIALWTRVPSQLWTGVKYVPKLSNHSVTLWTRVTSQLWTCVRYVYRSSPFRSTLNTSCITALDMCETCTEAVNSVALGTWKQTTQKRCPGLRAVGKNKIMWHLIKTGCPRVAAGRNTIGNILTEHPTVKFTEKPFRIRGVGGLDVTHLVARIPVCFGQIARFDDASRNRENSWCTRCSCHYTPGSIQKFLLFFIRYHMPVSFKHIFGDKVIRVPVFGNASGQLGMSLFDFSKMSANQDGLTVRPVTFDREQRQQQQQQHHQIKLGLQRHLRACSKAQSQNARMYNTPAIYMRPKCANERVPTIRLKFWVPRMLWTAHASST